MGRKSFFEKLEKEIDLQKEYEKIESLVLHNQLDLAWHQLKMI